MKTITTKKLLASLITLASVGCVLAAKVSVDPIYQDARFTPANTLHAGCVNSANIAFQAEGTSIENVHLVMDYNPTDIQIVRIASDADQSLVNYNIENDRIILNFLNANGEKLSNKNIFKMYFQGENTLTQTSLSVSSGSYALTKDGSKIALTNKTNLTFGVAQECEPDELAPIVSLSVPQDTKARLPLDAYFVRDVRDMGKGVDKNSVTIEFGGKKYTGPSQYIQWNGNYLFFYPQEWLPIDEEMILQISIADSQIYGGANVSRKQFKFQSATGMVLQNKVTPEIYRSIAKKSTVVAGSDLECKILKNVYAAGNDTDKSYIKSVLKKMLCDTSDLAFIMKQENNEKVSAANIIAAQKEENVSVLVVIGWMLFAIALGLKIHYYLGYRRHKKLYEGVTN